MSRLVSLPQLLVTWYELLVATGRTRLLRSFLDENLHPNRQMVPDNLNMLKQNTNRLIKLDILEAPSSTLQLGP